MSEQQLNDFELCVLSEFSGQDKNFIFEKNQVFGWHGQLDVLTLNKPKTGNILTRKFFGGKRQNIQWRI